MEENRYTRDPNLIVYYGVRWCPDCFRTRRVLAKSSVEFLEIDIDKDPQGAAFVKEVNGGNRSVPTIIFPDGTILVEPSNKELKKNL